jgi:hypothetical protein
MKYFLSGILLALIMGVGVSALVFSGLTDDSVARNCTWSEVKACVDAGGSHPGSTCCPPKFQMENPIGALETADNIAKNCTWTEVKLCYDGIANRCCPPKNMEMVQLQVEDDSLVKNCTWGEVKACYSGVPVTNSKCCPPKFIMDSPIG